MKGLSAARAALEIEAAAVSKLLDRLDAEFAAAVQLLADVRGKVIVSGIGKSGHIGRKIAASFASTGTPALFVHAVEALHGDAGVCMHGDVALLISNSGKTPEVCEFASVLRRREIPVIAMTGELDSRLAELAWVTLDISVEREADPLNLAPTASTTVTAALGDALLAALMSVKNFTPDDFFENHPAGALGHRLATIRSER